MKNPKDPTNPATSRAIVLVSGQSGAGKTTLGCNLAEHYQNVVHFDGDIFYHCGNPIAEAGTYNGVKEASTQDEEVTQARAGLVANYEDLFDSRNVPLERWVPVLEPFCQAVAQASSLHHTLIVSLALYQATVRRWTQQRIHEIIVENCKDRGDVNIQRVVLHDAEGAAPKRKLGMVKDAARSKSQTIEEFLASYNQTFDGEEELLRKMARNQTGFEAGCDDEIAITLAADMDQMVVLEVTAQCLSLIKKAS